MDDGKMPFYNDCRISERSDQKTQIKVNVAAVIKTASAEAIFSHVVPSQDTGHVLYVWVLSTRLSLDTLVEF